MLEIIDLPPASTAAGIGLRPGDKILAINNQEVNDAIDFQFSASDDRLVLTVLKKDGSIKKLKIVKDPDDNLGLEFPPLQIKRCRNKCIFCFVDQMPAGCRKTLYVKDDDFRASFLYGNFITLGALSESDWDRIFKQRLSPLYISVHTTEHDIRTALLRNRNAPDIMSSLRRLAAGGIRMHTQIVLCPGINDGEHLARTITDLSGLFPSVSSIAVVPVGVTRFRSRLSPLRIFSPREARIVIDSIEQFGRKFKKKFGTRLVFPADEFYIKARRPVPAASFYEECPQIENGVGMVASFLSEVRCTRIPGNIGPVAATVITGASFSKVLAEVLKSLNMIKGVSLRQITVNNNFFGSSVTVTGLLTGKDILQTLKRKKLGDILFVPSNTLKENEAVFLDGMGIEELGRKLKVRVVAVDGFRDLVNVLSKRGGTA